MKNLKIVNKKKFLKSILIVCLIVIGIIFFSAKASLSHNEISNIKYDTITVIQGDTLWEISRNQQENNPYYANKDVRDIIKNIRKVNELKTADLKVGQTLKIPTI